MLSDSCERSNFAPETKDKRAEKTKSPARGRALVDAYAWEPALSDAEGPVPYQMAQRFAGAIGAPVLQPKAF